MQGFEGMGILFQGHRSGLLLIHALIRDSCGRGKGRMH
jgi:hypothetical protein